MNTLLSRHAESVFWMARYIERAESVARIFETQTSFYRGRGSDNSSDNSWAWIIALYSDYEAFDKAFSERTPEHVIRFYLSHIDNPGSVQSSVRAARENARGLRHMLSTDMWYHLNDFYNRLLALGPSDYSETRLSRTCDAIKRGCYAQVGVAENTLYQDETWPFFRLGQYMERADQMSRLLDVRFAQVQTGLAQDEGHFDYTFWAILLRAASAYHAFRRLSPRHTEPSEVARFLIFDPRMPRSIAYCLNEITNLIDILRRNFGLRNAAASAQEVENLISGLQVANADDKLLERLHAFNDWVQLGLMKVTNELGLAFFGYTPEETAAATPAVTVIGEQKQSQTIV